MSQTPYIVPLLGRVKALFQDTNLKNDEFVDVYPYTLPFFLNKSLWQKKLHEDPTKLARLSQTECRSFEATDKAWDKYQHLLTEQKEALLNLKAFMGFVSREIQHIRFRELGKEQAKLYVDIGIFPEVDHNLMEALLEHTSDTVTLSFPVTLPSMAVFGDIISLCYTSKATPQGSDSFYIKRIIESCTVLRILEIDVPGHMASLLLKTIKPSMQQQITYLDMSGDFSCSDVPYICDHYPNLNSCYFDKAEFEGKDVAVLLETEWLHCRISVLDLKVRDGRCQFELQMLNKSTPNPERIV